MKSRLAVFLVAALAYGGYRVYPHLAPAVQVSQAAPFTDLAKVAASMSRHDKANLRDAYETLSKAVAADPDEDPVFVDTPAVRRAHRAALLFVWRGVLSNQAGEVPGLREALEGAVDSRIGSSEIPMNPALRAEAAKAFHDIAKSLQ